MILLCAEFRSTSTKTAYS